LSVPLTAHMISPAARSVQLGLEDTMPGRDGPARPFACEYINRELVIGAGHRAGHFAGTGSRATGLGRCKRRVAELGEARPGRLRGG